MATEQIKTMGKSLTFCMPVLVQVSELFRAHGTLLHLMYLTCEFLHRLTITSLRAPHNAVAFSAVLVVNTISVSEMRISSLAADWPPDLNPRNCWKSSWNGNCDNMAIKSSSKSRIQLVSGSSSYREIQPLLEALEYWYITGTKGE